MRIVHHHPNHSYFKDETPHTKSERLKDYQRTDPAIYIGGSEEVESFLRDHPEIWGVLALEKNTKDDVIETYRSAAGNPDLYVHIERFTDWDERVYRAPRFDSKLGFLHIHRIAEFLRQWFRLDPVPSIVVHCAQGIFRSTAVGLAAHALITNEPKKSAEQLVACQCHADANWHVAQLLDDEFAFNGRLELAARRIAFQREGECVSFFKSRVQDSSFRSEKEDLCPWCKGFNTSIDREGKYQYDDINRYMESRESRIDIDMNVFMALISMCPHGEVTYEDIARETGVGQESVEDSMEYFIWCVSNYDLSREFKVKRFIAMASFHPPLAEFARWVLGSAHRGSHMKKCSLRLAGRKPGLGVLMNDVKDANQEELLRIATSLLHSGYEGQLNEMMPILLEIVRSDILNEEIEEVVKTVLSLTNRTPRDYDHTGGVSDITRPLTGWLVDDNPRVPAFAKRQIEIHRQRIPDWRKSDWD